MDRELKRRYRANNRGDGASPMHPRRLLCLSAFSLALLAACASAPMVHPTGVRRLDFNRIDDLLVLPDNPRAGVLLVEDNDPDRVSDVHLQRLRRWVADGGVLWAAGDGLQSALVRQLADVQDEDYTYQKTSTENRGGELVVRGASPQLVIEDHPLTKGVRELYLFPRRKFDGTRDAQPLVRMTGANGESGTVIAAVPLGEGYVVLDGTARDERLLFGRLPEFDQNHPNAVKLESGWTNYDWDRMLENASRNASS
ncbi:MAG TPA: hypothetical protein VFV75_06240 [Candidatus Polarisedimenticolaceae bacterium]|nr:hypothetical protein [Candidatus Polarisedimenticolaceae bacterium]